ncbi:MAG: zf-HC2 domain-containing protein [Chlorobium sp.]|nr:MAG: zf-HC2 domain-containing protein [Chlorobium sp.]
MNCQKARVFMSAAVDGELTLKEEQDFLLHLVECRECKEEFEDAKKTKMIIKERIVQFKAPQTLINSIMQLTIVSTREPEDTLLYE